MSQKQAGLPCDGGPDQDWTPGKRRMQQEASPAAGQGALSWGASRGSRCTRELVLHSQQALRSSPVTAKRDPTGGAGVHCGESQDHLPWAS